MREASLLPLPLKALKSTPQPLTAHARSLKTSKFCMSVTLSPTVVANAAKNTHHNCFADPPPLYFDFFQQKRTGRKRDPSVCPQHSPVSGAFVLRAISTCAPTPCRRPPQRQKLGLNQPLMHENEKPTDFIAPIGGCNHVQTPMPWSWLVIFVKPPCPPRGTCQAPVPLPFSAVHPLAVARTCVFLLRVGSPLSAFCYQDSHITLRPLSLGARMCVMKPCTIVFSGIFQVSLFFLRHNHNRY